MSAVYYTVDTAYSVHTQELVTLTMQNDYKIISATPLVYYAIAVPVGLLAMCLGLIVLTLCVYVCNQHRKYLLEHKNGDSHEQEPVYFTIEPICDHQQATGVESKQTCLHETAGESNTILIESTYDVISGCHNNMIYENLDTANAETTDTLPNSEVNANDNVSLSAVLDKESKVSNNEN